MAQQRPTIQGPDSGPQRFGRYILLNQLGAGGMAEVFRAVVVGPEEFQRVLVVKRILPRLSADPAFVKMFIDEATLCGRLSHPNIIQVHEFGRQGDQYFIAMEYVHGRTLNQLLRRLAQRRKPLPFNIAAEILRQVCRGLAYAHTLTAADGRPLHIIHRDVSPGNVIVGYSGQVKLLDFGIARAEARFRVGDTQPGQVKGKSAYLAPEQVTSDAVDHRADIFAAGILLFELTTGHRLFKAGSPLECMNRVTSLPIPMPSSLEPDLPTPLENVVLKALQRTREERYQSAADMADDLEHFLLDRGFLDRDLPTFVSTLFRLETAEDRPQVTPEEMLWLAEMTGVSEAPIAAPPEPGPIPSTTTLRVSGLRWRRAGWVLAGVAAAAVVALLAREQPTPAPALASPARIATERASPPPLSRPLPPAAVLPVDPAAAAPIEPQAAPVGGKKVRGKAIDPDRRRSDSKKVRNALPIDPFAK